MNLNKRDIQKEETLLNIRNSIRELVTEVGYDNMTIRMICKRANVSTGAFYYHFKSKDDILYDHYLFTMKHFESIYNNNLVKLDPILALNKLIEELVSYTSTIIKELDVPYHRAFITEYAIWSKRSPDMIRWIMNDCFTRAYEMKILNDNFSPAQRSEMLWNMYIGSKIIYCTIGQGFFDYNKISYQFKEWVDLVCSK